VRGVDVVGSLPRAANIASEEVRHALAEPLETILDAVKATLDGCSPELAADLVDRGIVLCGGGALLRGLDRYLAEQTGLPIRVAADPQATVLNGTLVCLENLGRWKTSLITSDDVVG
jgi:rod shape-determining protein MreB and related proteins